jgi:hypothetical protein
MGVLESGTTTAVMEVGAASYQAAHVQVKPIAHGVLGHYRSTIRTFLTTNMSADTRIWEVRNRQSTLIVPTRLRVYMLQTVASTPVQLQRLDLYKVTGFTAVDTASTTNPASSVKRVSGMGVVTVPLETINAPANLPGIGADIRFLVVAGAVGGMTGGTMTFDGGASSMVELWNLAAVPTAIRNDITAELLDDVNGTHPFVLAQNEGLVIRNGPAIGATSGGISVLIDFSWAEVSAY